jgi:hypothetical protein
LRVECHGADGRPVARAARPASRVAFAGLKVDFISSREDLLVVKHRYLARVANSLDRGMRAKRRSRNDPPLAAVLHAQKTCASRAATQISSPVKASRGSIAAFFSCLSWVDWDVPAGHVPQLVVYPKCIGAAALPFLRLMCAPVRCLTAQALALLRFWRCSPRKWRACKSWGGRFRQAPWLAARISRFVLFVGRCRFGDAGPMHLL